MALFGFDHVWQELLHRKPVADQVYAEYARQGVVCRFQDFIRLRYSSVVDQYGGSANFVSNLLCSFVEVVLFRDITLVEEDI